MKGIIYNLLEQVVSNQYGEDAWDSLLEQAGVEGAYTSLGAYSDDEFYRLIGAASVTLKMTSDEVLQWFARRSLPLIAGKFPAFFQPHQSTRSFLLTLNDVIHPEVRKLFPGADVPIFNFETSDREFLTMYYSSHRKLCTFAIGLIEGSAEQYGEDVSVDHPTCMKRGDAACTLQLTFRNSKRRRKTQL